jgi:glycerol uptake facilitator-like aquaporin
MKIVRFLVYVTAQMIGAFFAAFTVWVVYLDAINKESDQNKTAGIFATYPNPNLSTFGGFFDQFIATSLLIIVVLAITDKKNNQIQNGTSNIIVGLTVTIIGTAFGYNCGYAINPARDLGLLDYFRIIIVIQKSNFTI